MEDRECIEKFLIYNASLVISGVKPSATVTLKKGNNNLYDKWIKYGISFLKSINIEFVELRESQDALIILVYDKEELENYIFNKSNKQFLVQLGYEEENNIESYINKLKERYEKFKCPHELGVFLGFPLEDVKDFMECTNKKCLVCGYWMVYNNFNNAKEIFNKYDKVKEHAVNNILSGDSTHNIAFNIRNFIKNYEKISV